MEGLGGGGCEPWAGARRGRGRRPPPNSDISLQEWLEALKPTSFLFCTNSQAAAPLSPACLRPVVNSQKIMCPEVLAASPAGSIFSCLALAACSSLTPLQPATGALPLSPSHAGSLWWALLPATQPRQQLESPLLFPGHAAPRRGGGPHLPARHACSVFQWSLIVQNSGGGRGRTLQSQPNEEFQKSNHIKFLKLPAGKAPAGAELPGLIAPVSLPQKLYLGPSLPRCRVSPSEGAIAN